MKIEKIHIIGGPGSGKSYLAAKIAEKINAKAYNLDDIYWDNDAHKYGVHAEEKFRSTELKKILIKSCWIIEGVYYEWVMESFRKADIIIVLQPRVALRAWRIVTRYFARKMGLLERKKKETLKGLFRLLKWNRDFDRVNLKAAMDIFDTLRVKYRVLSSTDEIRKFIKELK